MENHLLSCDWGTSSFRLILYDTRQEKVAGELQSANGISVVHKSWQNRDATEKGQVRADFFRAFLKEEIKSLADKLKLDLTGLPLLISGMASSSIGIADLPYAMLPFKLDGSGMNTEIFEAETHFPHRIILISGVKSDHDVMRGEETQLIGIWSALLRQNKEPREAIFIFPGTHSKHIYVREGRLIDFKTFMTGEMYQLIAHNSILKNSIRISETQNGTETELSAFKAGVRNAMQSPLLNSLFTVRTNQLFELLAKNENAYYLSGLLIGSELNDLAKQQAMQFFLCSGQKLFTFYRLAFEEIGLADRTSFVSPEEVDRAAIAGHKIIFQNHELRKMLTR